MKTGIFLIKGQLIVALIFFSALNVLHSSSAKASSDYYCEVMTLKSGAFVTNSDSVHQPLKEGDLLKTGDLLIVDKDSQVDLAFDREWNNLTRIFGFSTVKIKSIYPTGLGLDHGDIFAKLGNLPQGMTFEIQTPTAIAAVRGTEFLTSVSDQGATTVVSYEHSVEVFNLDASGQLDHQVIVAEAQKTVVNQLSEAPAPPVKAPESDLQKITGMSADMSRHVKEALESGRQARIQSAGSVQALLKLSEIAKKTRGDQNKDKEGSDNRKPLGNNNGGGPGGGTADGGSDLNTGQRSQMKDQFIRLGGDPKDFNLAEESMKTGGITSDNFDRFNATTVNFIEHPDSFGPPPIPTEAMPNPGSTASLTGPNPYLGQPPPFDPTKTQNNVPFFGGMPTGIQQIEKQMDRTLSSNTFTQASGCTSDPSLCPGGLPPKYHTDGTLCTPQNPC